MGASVRTAGESSEKRATSSPPARRSPGRAVATAGALLLTAAAAAAQPTGAIELEWQAPTGDCPSREAVLAGVDALVRRVPDAAARARVTIASSDAAWIADLELAEGHRRLTGASCAEVADALIVILAIAVDPDAAALADASSEPAEEATFTLLPAPFPAPEPPSDASPSSLVTVDVAPPLPAAPVPPAAAPVAAAALPPPKLGVSLFALGEAGALPDASVGAEVAVRVIQGPVAVEVAYLGLAERRATRAGQPTMGGDIRLSAGAASVCWQPPSSLALGCLGLEVGHLRGDGFGVEWPDTARGVWVATAASGGVRGRLQGDLALETRLAIAVPLSRPEFGLDPYADVVFRPSSITARALLGLAWH